MTAILQDPIFQDEAAAREWLEARVWPTGPVCPHCGVTSEHVTKLVRYEAPSWPLPVQRVPRAIHGHGQHRI
jgi:Transposase zinc-ribbon domain